MIADPLAQLGPRVLATSRLGALIEVGPAAAPVVYLHVGHHGPGTGARGVAGDEWALCSDYATAAAARLAALGLRVQLDLRGGDYKTRSGSVVVSSAGAALYVQCHLNAGLPAGARQRGIVFFDRSTAPGRGDLAARLVSESLSGVGYSVEARPTFAGDPLYPRVYPCIRYIRPAALLIEPAFLERPISVALIGATLADGIAATIAAWVSAGVISGWAP